MKRPEGESGPAASGEPPLEHRWEEQFRCRARVRLSTERGMTGTGRIRVISASGAFIETLFQPGLAARLHLYILGNETARDVVERAATVVRLATDGIGVEWNSAPTRAICSALGCAVRCDQPDEGEHT